MAAHLGFKEAGAKAKPAVMEPVMKVEVRVPSEYLGDVSSDLNRRRSILKEVEAGVTHQIIKADVPLSEMFGYITTLRTLTQGRGNFSMEFSHYARVSDDLAEIVIKKAKGIFF